MEEKHGVQADGEEVDTGLNGRGTLVGLEVDGKEAKRGGEDQYRARKVRKREEELTRLLREKAEVEEGREVRRVRSASSIERRARRRRTDGHDDDGVQEGSEVAEKRSAVREDLERNGRVLDEGALDDEEGGDTDETKDEGDENLVRRPGISDAAPGQGEDEGGRSGDEDQVAVRAGECQRSSSTEKRGRRRTHSPFARASPSSSFVAP
jgi:hypothetical protein